jgi:PTS system ascorbate-specific IIA component
MDMLRDFVEKGRTLFVEGAETWQEAVRLSCEPLERDGTVDKTYADEVIACVEKHGPYIAIIPGIAIPHSQENALGAHGTGIGFMKLERPVVFDPDDPEKYASVFFAIASTNPDEHLKNMRSLFKMLTNDDLVDDLQKTGSDKDLILLAEKYNI